MCNLSGIPHSNLEKDNSLNHSCVSPKMGCLEYTTKNMASTRSSLFVSSGGSDLQKVTKLILQVHAENGYG